MNSERADDLRAFVLLQEAALQAAETIESHCPVNPFLAYKTWLEEMIEETQEKSAATFTFGNTEEPHIVGSEKCLPCWMYYPRPCENDGCDGLVHATFGDEDSSGDYWLYHCCDRCSMVFKPPASRQPSPPIR